MTEPFFNLTWREPKKDSSFFFGRLDSSLQRLNALSCRALLALHQIKLHFLTLGEGLKALTTDGGVMDENVAGIRLDKTEALGVVEPLYCPSLALRHGNSPVFGVYVGRRSHTGLN